MLEPCVAWSVSLPSCSSQFIHMHFGTTWSASYRLIHPILQLLPCCASSLPQLPVSAPPTSWNECFFFNSLVVRLLHGSIFWQFWLFFVFKFVVVLLLVTQGAKVYLPMPPSWPEVIISTRHLTFLSLYLSVKWQCSHLMQLPPRVDVGIQWLQKHSANFKRLYNCRMVL